MKKKKRAGSPARAPKPPAVAAAPPSRNRCRLLIWVDATPHRARTAKQYQELKKKIEETTAEIEEFERVKAPAYEAWHASTFGPLLTEHRDLSEALTEKLAFVDQVQKEQALRGGSLEAAYQRVLKARSRREAGLQGREGQPTPGEEKEAEEEEEAGGFNSFAAMFREAIRNLLGIDPDDLRASERARFEKAFRRDMGMDGPPVKKPARPAPPGATEAQCKQIYRMLVRKLHPDTGAPVTAQARQLWDDLQDAWQRRDLERLKLIESLVEMQGTGAEPNFSAATLGQLRQIVKELARVWRKTQQHRRSLDDHPASRLADPKSAKRLATTIRAEFGRDIREMRADIAEIEAIIQTWIAPRPPKKGKGASSRQGEFGF